jgi:hypothetical protein
MAQDWKKVVDDARAEIEALEIRREDINKRIAQLKRIILAGEPLSQPEYTGLADTLILEAEAQGITEACREVLRSSGKFMSPLAVRSALEAKGLDLSKQKNAMASIHTVLKRLKEKHEVIARTGMDGGTVYRSNPLHRRHVLRKPLGLGLPPVVVVGATVAQKSESK